jgi:2-methylcitrate dehydratase PrpD
MSEELKETIAEKIAGITVETQYEDLPKDVAEKSKRFILDLLGCTLGAKDIQSSKIMTQVMSNLGGAPQSTVIGYSHKTSAPLAAMINATTGHAFDMDDDHREGTLHSSVVIFPAVFAMAEQAKVDGKQLITAFALGSELMIRLGESFLGQTYYQGFHPTGTTGVFGAALGAGKILSLGQQKLTWAQGIAGSQAAGLLEWKADGTWTKRLQAGHPSMTGVMSALLAREGYTGPVGIYEGPDGFVRAFSHKDQYDLNKIHDAFGERWELAINSIKPHSCCRFACPVVDCALDIAKNNDIKPEDIEDIEAGLNKWMIKVLCEPADRKYNWKTVVDCQFGLPYVVAVSLIKKRASVPEFTDEAIEDPAVRALAQKVRWTYSEEFEKMYPKAYPASVTVKTKDGKTYYSRVDFPKGDPENPVTDEELLDKFYLLSSRNISKRQGQRISEAVLNLEKMEDVNDLAGLLR